MYYKARGLNLDKVVLQFGDQEKIPFMGYVALSAERLLNIMIIPPHFVDIRFNDPAFFQE